MELSSIYRKIEFVKLSLLVGIFSWATVYTSKILPYVVKYKVIPYEEFAKAIAESFIYNYYWILAIIVVFAYAVFYITKKPYVPMFSVPQYPIIYIISIIIAGMLFLGSMLGFLRLGIPTRFDPTNAFLTAFINGCKGLVENSFFIGLVGFSLWTFLSRERRDPFTAILTAMIVGYLAVIWHIGQYYAIYRKELGLTEAFIHNFVTIMLFIGISIFVITMLVYFLSAKEDKAATIIGIFGILGIICLMFYLLMTTLPLIFGYAAAIFIFFTILAILSFIVDSTWPADIVHFVNNFGLTLFTLMGYVIL